MLAVLSEDWSSFSLCSAVLLDGWSSAGCVQQYCICLMFISIWSCSGLCSTISGLVFVCV